MPALVVTVRQKIYDQSAQLEAMVEEKQLKYVTITILSTEMDAIAYAQ
jgi:hypothetical protein